MNIEEKMHTEDLYISNDEALMEKQMYYLDRLYDFNQIRPSERAKRENMLKEMFSEIGEVVI